jgi:hypothetical protein
MSSITSIGLRVYSNQRVFYTLIERSPSGDLSYLDISFLSIPLSLDVPESLSFIRNTLIDIMLEYNVNRAAIRIAEYTGTLDRIAIARTYYEGVIQESLESSQVEKYVAGQISRLSKLAEIEKTDFKLLRDGEIEFKMFPTDRDWKKLSKEERESVLAAYAALQL